MDSKMADLVSRNKNFFALLQDLSDSDSETPQEPVKKPETKAAKTAPPKTSQTKASQPKPQKQKQAPTSKQPLNPLPSVPQDQDKKPAERQTQSRQQERPKREGGAAAVEAKSNTQHDHKRRPAQGDDRKDRSGKGTREANKGGNSRHNWGQPGAEASTEEVKHEDVPVEEGAEGTQEAEVKKEEPKEPEIESITLSEFYGKKLSWGTEVKLQKKLGVASQYSDLLSFQVKTVQDQEYVRSDRKPNRGPRIEKQGRTYNQPRKQENRPKKTE